MKKNRTRIRARILRTYYAFTEQMLRPLVRSSVSPDMISLVSLIMSLVAGAMYSRGFFFTGGITLLLSGFLDTLDGTMARLTGKSSRFGALLDSTFDRYADFFVFAGLLIYYRYHWMLFIIILAMLGSFMVSYIKARAEALGTIRVVGFMQRPERVLLLVAGSLLTLPSSWYSVDYTEIPIVTAVSLLALLSNITALHRLIAARKDLSERNVSSH